MKKKRSLASYLIVYLSSLLAAVLDIGIAYICIDLILGYTLTWPMILLAGWIAQAVFANQIRDTF